MTLLLEITCLWLHLRAKLSQLVSLSSLFWTQRKLVLYVYILLHFLLKISPLLCEKSSEPNTNQLYLGNIPRQLWVVFLFVLFHAMLLFSYCPFVWVYLSWQAKAEDFVKLVMLTTLSKTNSHLVSLSSNASVSKYQWISFRSYQRGTRLPDRGAGFSLRRSIASIIFNMQAP